MPTPAKLATLTGMSSQTSLGALLVAMVMMQKYGAEIIGFLHGAEARHLAVTPGSNGLDDCLPTAPWDELCPCYEAHHFDRWSNISHYAGFFHCKLNLVLLPLSNISSCYYGHLSPSWLHLVCSRVGHGQPC